MRGCAFCTALLCTLNFTNVCDLCYFIFLQLVSEQERIDLEWQAERKDAKRAYLRQLEDFEEEKSRETVSPPLLYPH